jgi:hypothetical protein
MRVGTTSAKLVFGQTHITLTEPFPLTFVDLRPTERNKVILATAVIKRLSASSCLPADAQRVSSPGRQGQRDPLQIRRPSLRNVRSPIEQTGEQCVNIKFFIR